MDVESKIIQLRTKIREADHAYYVEANPVLGDAAYDRLLAELVDLERQYPEFLDPNSPTARVGGASDAFTSQAHERPMLSLDNTYDHDDLKEWFDRVLRSLGDDDSSQRASGSSSKLKTSQVCLWLLSPRLMVWRSVCDGSRATWCWP